MSKRLLIAGFACCALSLLLPPLGVVPFVIGVIALIRGRIAAGVTLVLLSLALPLAGALTLQAYVLKPYRIPSEAMLPTLEIDDRIAVLRLGADPHVGDIVVVHPPVGAESGEGCRARQQRGQACPRPAGGRADVNFIKRIVAGPGDRIAIAGGRVILNGSRRPEPFAASCDGEACDLPTPTTIPPDHWFMMGDNRGASDDSRFWGPVPGDWIVGRAFARYWPIGRVGGL